MKQTPMLQQYLELKRQHQDALLLYRLGDFYELFFEDAERAAPILGIVLTKRRHNEDVTSPMCGIPHRAVANYVGKLLDANFKVAIAEQVEEPGKGGLVRREVIRVLTPGTVTEPELLGDGERRWLASVIPGDHVAVAFLEPASGEFGGASCVHSAEARELLAQLRPREILLPEGRGGLDGLWPEELPTPVITTRPADWFEARRAEDEMRNALAVGSLRAFDLDPGEPLVGAAGALLAYMRSTQRETPRHVHSFTRRRQRLELVLDAAAVRNLEIVRTSSGERRGSLAATLDETATPMGARLLRDWLLRPLRDPEEASSRHEAVAAFIEDTRQLVAVREQLQRLGDLERAAARLGLRQARPGELGAVGAALASLPSLRGELESSRSRLVAAFGRQVDVLEDLRHDLAATLADEPPAIPGPGMIRMGLDAELDEARQLAHGGKEVLGEIEARERALSGITTLKIRYNRVFGYALEVPKAHLEKVPPAWIRRQTLTGAERFVTPELEELERRITGAEAVAAQREGELYSALLDRCAGRAARLAATAHALACVDVLTGFAETARRRHYCRPRLVPEARVRLVAARHPVIEGVTRVSFVPNDVELDGASHQIIVLTGPNMGGKSTYLRQVALAVVMAWAGSFVAADEAEIGAVDRVFTRVGAADDIARGESTFMVEMTEVAAILRQATPHSLVVLDEVGRGTATFDGLSLAWAVVEALHDAAAPNPGPLVLFATHYHELTDLAQRLSRVVNASVAVKEWQGQLLFLHRVVPGPSDRSYGIHVARLAGVPESVCTRAEQVLQLLSSEEIKVVEATVGGSGAQQLPLFGGAENAITERLRKTRIDSLTPLEALNLLADLKREVES